MKYQLLITTTHSSDEKGKHTPNQEPVYEVTDRQPVSPN
jgi:hypothetical protein